MKENKMWRRSVHSNYGVPEKISELNPDTYLTNKLPEDMYTYDILEKQEPPGAWVFKYKKVENRVRPVPAVMPEDVKVKRTFPNDPLSNLPVLPTHPPEFSPTEKMTQERMDKLEIDNNPDLWEEEK